MQPNICDLNYFAFMEKNLAIFYTVFLNNLPLFNEYVLTFQIIELYYLVSVIGSWSKNVSHYSSYLGN